MSEVPPGLVIGLFLANLAGGTMLSADSVEAVAGRGFVGDRCDLGTGHYSGKPRGESNVTLIESEAIAAINTGYKTGKSSVYGGVRLPAM